MEDVKSVVDNEYCEVVKNVVFQGPDAVLVLTVGSYADPFQYNMGDVADPDAKAPNSAKSPATIAFPLVLTAIEF